MDTVNQHEVNTIGTHDARTLVLFDRDFMGGDFKIARVDGRERGDVCIKVPRLVPQKAVFQVKCR